MLYNVILNKYIFYIYIIFSGNKEQYSILFLETSDFEWTKTTLLICFLNLVNPLKLCTEIA